MRLRSAQERNMCQHSANMAPGLRDPTEHLEPEGSLKASLQAATPLETLQQEHCEQACFRNKPLQKCSQSFGKSWLFL